MRHFLYFFIALLTICAGCNTQTNVVNGVTERDANEIVVLLASKGIQAKKTQAAAGIGGSTEAAKYDITVSAGQITEALSVLNQVGLPRVKGTSLLDIFGTSGLVPSDMQDRIRYQEGLSEQLATTIRKMDGIIDANVQITFKEEGDQEKGLTASVYVQHRGILDNPNSLAVTKIKRLVSSAVPNLTAENVSVITDRALYADLALQPTQQLEEGNYVSLWSVHVAKDSVTRFRLIFYAFIILLFLLACTIAWLIWKFWPIIESEGGTETLFYPRPYEPRVVKTEVEEERGEG